MFDLAIRFRYCSTQTDHQLNQGEDYGQKGLDQEE